MEFLQNADDNHYEPNVVPELCLSFEDDRIRIECNEIGFNEANVQAICKIGASTKRSMTGYIGAPQMLSSMSSMTYKMISR